MKVAFVGCRACAAISMASKRYDLFATHYSCTYDCSKVLFCLLDFFYKHFLVLRECRSLLAREILLCEQRRTDHKRVPKNNYIFEFPCNLVTLK